MALRDADPAPTLVRGMGAWGATLLTVGSVLGTGIFLTTSDIARVLPHAGWILLAWVAGGLLTLAGALTYAELGALYPEAGGLYHYLREAYGPLAGFLFGWASFLIIMSGGIAALAAGLGQYLAGWVPGLSPDPPWLSLPIGSWTWTLSGGQAVAAIAIVALTAVNHAGLKAGAGLQNALTVVKIGSLLALAGFAFLVPARAAASWLGPLGSAGGTAPAGGLLAAFGVAMIAVLWTFDGWYGLTCSAGEVRDPGRNLPRGLILGTAIVTALYLAVHLAYFRALPVAAMAAQPRIAEAAAAALFGPLGARLLSAAVVVSIVGCLSATLLYSSRIYPPMAADGLFFPALARIDPRFRTPVTSLWAQSAWAVLLALSGSFEQLYTYVIFVSFVFHGATAAAVFVLRRRRPDAFRPYRTWGYPAVPLLFIGACALIVANTLAERPVEALWGSGLLALGVPAYLAFRRRGLS
jgi:APA family basic amino acid/polyamine antiporter